MMLGKVLILPDDWQVGSQAILSEYYNKQNQFLELN